MTSTFKQFKARALARPDVKKAYDELSEEFSFIDEILKARATSGLTQAELAARVGTTQSAIARLESGTLKHSPSIVTLQRYEPSSRDKTRQGTRANHAFEGAPIKPRVLQRER